MTPFVDVALALMLIFMVTARMIVARGVDVEKPRSSVPAIGTSRARSWSRSTPWPTLYVMGGSSPIAPPPSAPSRAWPGPRPSRAAIIAGDTRVAYGAIFMAIEVPTGRRGDVDRPRQRPAARRPDPGPAEVAMAQSRTLTLAIAGSLAMHLTLALAIDVATVVGRVEDTPPPPRLTLVDLDTRPLEPPPPPVEPAEAAAADPRTPPAPGATARTPARRRPRASAARRGDDRPAPARDASARARRTRRRAGGGRIAPGIAPAARGVRRAPPGQLCAEPAAGKLPAPRAVPAARSGAGSGSAPAASSGAFAPRRLHQAAEFTSSARPASTTLRRRASWPGGGAPSLGVEARSGSACSSTPPAR
ncbi:MAG: hypothetical protein HS111_06460 [Kofleriaceae bacterium]|nr:hypothetical protein [Kofleriaceae bacterium]